MTRMKDIIIVITSCVAIWAAACDETIDAGPLDGGETDSSSDAGVDAGTPPDPEADCATLGFSPVEFTVAEDSAALRALAADVAIPTRTGPLGLAALWTGCDSLLFVLDHPRQNVGFPDEWWESAVDLEDLFDRLPRGARLFFVSAHDDETERLAALDKLEALLADTLADYDAETGAWWRGRTHLVTAAAAELPGWLGQRLAAPAYGLAVDREQRIRDLGSFGDPRRFDAGVGWFAPNLAQLADEVIAYDREAALAARLAAQSASVITVFDREAIADPEWAGVRGASEVTLPSAAAMAGFDTLELDLFLGCGGVGEYGYCPAWDRNVSLYLCAPGETEGCSIELGRWITSYHREGRFVHDVSELLPLLAAGGARRFEWHSIDPWEVTLRLRLSNDGKASRPAEVTTLFVGNPTLDGTYNEQYTPLVVNVPADAAKVEIAMLLTGHGMSPPANCAEFCNTDHHFLVNGMDHVRDFPSAGSLFGCRDAVPAGVIPNQYGTWWYGRAGWCPGQQVELATIDVTGSVYPGEENTFEYQGYYLGMNYEGTDWRNVDLASWLVISR